MPEQVSRSSLERRSVTRGTRDRNSARARASRAVSERAPDARALRAASAPRQGAGRGREAGGARERDLRAASGVSPRGGRNGSASAPRRTVVIRGQVADDYGSRRRSSRSLPISGSYGLGMRPERAAFWAVLLGVALVVVALASAHM